MAHLLFQLGEIVFFFGANRVLAFIPARRAARRFSASLSIAIEEANTHTSMQNVVSPIISIIEHLLCYDSLNHPERGGSLTPTRNEPVPQAASEPEYCREPTPSVSPFHAASLCLSGLPMSWFGTRAPSFTDGSTETLLLGPEAMAGSILSLAQRGPDGYPPRHHH